MEGEALWATVVTVWGGAVFFGLVLFALEAVLKLLARWFGDW